MKDNKILFETETIHKGNYELGKQKLKKYFDDINENSGPHKIYSGPIKGCQSILKSAAYLYNYSIPQHLYAD